MEFRDYVDSDKESVVDMARRWLERMFNGNSDEFKVLKEFDVTAGYVKYLVIIIDGKVVACGALKKLSDDEVRLKRMYVDRQYQGRGFASKILRELMSFAKAAGFKRVLFHTYPVMENARRFHKAHGFVETEGDDPEQIHFVREL